MYVLNCRLGNIIIADKFGTRFSFIFFCCFLKQKMITGYTIFHCNLIALSFLGVDLRVVKNSKIHEIFINCFKDPE